MMFPMGRTGRAEPSASRFPGGYTEPHLLHAWLVPSWIWPVRNLWEPKHVAPICFYFFFFLQGVREGIMWSQHSSNCQGRGFPREDKVEACRAPADSAGHRCWGEQGWVPVGWERPWGSSWTLGLGIGCPQWGAASRCIGYRVVVLGGRGSERACPGGTTGSADTGKKNALMRVGSTIPSEVFQEGVWLGYMSLFKPSWKTAAVLKINTPEYRCACRLVWTFPLIGVGVPLRGSEAEQYTEILSDFF